MTSIFDGGAGKAAKAQENAAREAAAVQRYATDESLKRYDRSYGDAAPYRQVGDSALAQLAGYFLDDYGGGGAAGAQKLTDFMQGTPGYQFQLGEGQRAIQNSAAARGMQLSGANLKALQQHGQGLADSTYRSTLGDLQGLVGVGQSALGHQASMASQAGQTQMQGANQMAQSLTNIGQAQANAATARGSAYQGMANLGFQTAGSLMGGGGLSGAAKTIGQFFL